MYRKLSQATASTFGVAWVMTSSGAPRARVNWNSQCRWLCPLLDWTPSTSSAMFSMTASVRSYGMRVTHADSTRRVWYVTPQ